MGAGMNLLELNKQNDKKMAAARKWFRSPDGEAEIKAMVKRGNEAKRRRQSGLVLPREDRFRIYGT